MKRERERERERERSAVSLILPNNCIFNKTNVMHFSNKVRRHSHFELMLGNENIIYMSVYRYLGVHLNKHLDFRVTADMLSKVGGRVWVPLFQRFKITKM